MSRYSIGRDNVLRDSHGYRIGQVGWDGEVYEGSFYRGSVNRGTYTDEFGRQMGHASTDESIGTSDFEDTVVSVFGGLIMLAMIAGAMYFIDKTSAEGGTTQSRFVQLPISKEKAFALCHGPALKGIKGMVKEHNIKTGRIWATTGSSFTSLGENIMICVTEAEGKANISIVSEPIVGLNKFSGAKNKRNVESIADALLKQFPRP